ncbi:sodium channel and clathrin linker 1 isoform X2 [Scleropages formosus]|uniref:Sodium channel and clathrin linker 1 n=2 Tax=Scleropages formosus TaxID=113540 RepID=A0A8C9RBL2_SCLFO|nr:sodium channel and clathrin linker 1 isoform X2 [Scleropages formosus]XP_018593780.1 sodium channel and clathrin linker 1 isoform X2 [Scleropages formosus]
MSAGVECSRDGVQRNNSAVSQNEDGYESQPTTSRDQATGIPESPPPWLSDGSIMAPLVAEYDGHIDNMNKQLRAYERQMAEIKVKLSAVVKENERLYAELRESIEKQLQAFPAGAEIESLTDDEIVKNLQEQIQLSLQEKDHAMELWQSAAQELDRLQQLYQKTTSDSQLLAVETQHTMEQLTQVQQLAQQLQVANQKLEATNQQFLKTVTEQNVELEDLRNQLRQAKQDLRTATAKVEEMTKLMQSVQDQMQRREEDAAAAHGREEASDRRLQQLQAALGQLEARLTAAAQEAERLRREQVTQERQVGELQGRCAALEEEKYEAITKVRENIQMAEEAALQKEQATLREKQKCEELEKMKEAIKMLIQEAAVRTRKEVENVRKQCNEQIHRMAEELSALQMECADKESQIERVLRERKALEEEVEKVYREGRDGGPEYQKINALHQRCLNTERLKDDLQVTLQTTQNKMKKMEMEYLEELSRCQEEVRRLQGALAGAQEDCSKVSEERLRLQQENQQLRREMEELRKASVQAQRKAKQQVSTIEHEFSLKEQELEARVRQLEESSQNSSADLNRLLVAQQRSTKRWKEEAHRMAEAFEHKLGSLRAELVRQKQRCQELEVQLEADHEKIVEYERQMAEYQEKNNRLQRRLTQAEQRASTASQQLSNITSQRRKAASMLDLEAL